MAHVLVTGGAGFIGSHTVDLLLTHGYDVRVLDSLQPRVHPHGPPSWLHADIEFILGDVADLATLRRALSGIDVVVHLAAYQDYLLDFSTFIRTNTESTAALFELIVNDPATYPVQKLVFASSQAVSGEGRYACPNCAGQRIPSIEEQLSDAACISTVPREHIVVPPPRQDAQLACGLWDICCTRCGVPMAPLLIDVDTVAPATTYAISKYAIELLARCLGARYHLPTVCLRYTYVQGPRNSVHNTYSGVTRRFALRAFAGEPLVIYEDGMQLRDYVHVKDIALANLTVLEDSRADSKVYHVGGGQAVTVHALAAVVLDAAGREPNAIVMPGLYRYGDTRHTISDIRPLQTLGWTPTIDLQTAVTEYLEWLRGQPQLPIAINRMREVDAEMRNSAVVRATEGKAMPC